MELHLQPSTEISADGSGSVAYAGDWAECLEALAAFRVARTDTSFKLVTFAPPAVMTQAPTPSVIADTPAEWAAAEAAAEGLLFVSAATLRAHPGGVGELTLRLADPSNLRESALSSLQDAAAQEQAARGAPSYSFGVAEIGRSALEYATAIEREHVLAWLAAPAALRAIFAYVNSETGYNAKLSGAEITLASKLLFGQGTVYSYAPTVTMSVSGAASADDIPENGAETPPPTGTFPGWSGDWRVAASASIQNGDGSHDASVTWQGAESNPPPETGA